MLRLRHDSFGLDGSTTLREASGSIPSGGLTDFGGPSFPLAIANKTPTKKYKCISEMDEVRTDGRAVPP